MSHIQKINHIVTIAFAAVVNITPAALANQQNTDKHAKKIETILDKLEKKLIDKETSPLTQEETTRDAIRKKATDNQNIPTPYRYAPKSPANINGTERQNKNIQELQKKLNEYESRLEFLESDMRKLQSDLHENAVTDNVVSIQVRIEDHQETTLKTLAVSLDGNSVYSQIDPAGLWIPAKTIPLFYGPLTPGTHRIDLVTNIATKNKTKNYGAEWLHKTISKTFEFSVLEGQQRRAITLQISTSSDPDRQPAVTILEADIK
jgi:hypothetical protein